MSSFDSHYNAVMQVLLLSPFKDEETKTQKGQVTCSRPNCKQDEEEDLARLPDSRTPAVC